MEVLSVAGPYISAYLREIKTLHMCTFVFWLHTRTMRTFPISSRAGGVQLTLLLMKCLRAFVVYSMRLEHMRSAT